MNIIIAYRHVHGEYFARQINKWKKSDYVIVVDRMETLRGLTNCTVWFLDSPRHCKTAYEMRCRCDAREIIEPQKHRLEVKEATLP